MTEMIEERYELAKKRIADLPGEPVLEGAWKDYFNAQATLLSKVAAVYERLSSKEQKVSREEYIRWNRELYQDILPDYYEESYANPDFSAKAFPEEDGKMAKLLTAVAAEMRVTIGYAYEQKAEELLIRMELLLELYTSVVDAFAEQKSAPEYETLREILYWYVSDYSDAASLQRVKEMVDPSEDFAYGILMESDLENTDYLYRYGEYITENEIRMSAYLAKLPQEKIDLIADTFTEGYRLGFVNTGKDLSRKTTVNIRYPLGFERVIRQAVRNFELLGLKCVIYRAGNSLFRRQGTSKVGYFGANPNKQYDYDHKEDEALFYDGQFITRKLECLKTAFETYKEAAYGHAGPAVMEVFGQQPFHPLVKETANCLSEAQQKLAVKFALSSGQITNEYIKGEERSFTIIAFPVPEIGEQFEEIFEETIRINTLDYKKYQAIQQTMIDTLDKAESVIIKGRGNNHTCLKVAMHGIEDPERQTQFENCVADVNIPVGEVFTSPRLKGTEGVLQVSRVYLNELEYRNLSVTIKDGMVTDYSCENFEEKQQNLKYFKDNVLYHHETLPVGEFAIGTNTTAYAAARKYDIAGKLPILIAEKTGPHFALGDTCYSHAEDIKVYNPDGKEIIARDNEVSLLRRTEPDKAYFNCHTDITIPYDELGSIEVLTKDGQVIPILEDGRFVLPGTEELNEALAT